MVVSLVEYIDKVNHGSDKPSRDNYFAARVAAQFLLLSHGTDIFGGPGLVPVAQALVRIRMDGEWLSGWNHPKKIAAALDDELQTVVDRMRGCKGCRKSISKQAWADLERLVEGAREHLVPKSTRPRRRVPRSTKAAVSKLLRTKAPASKR
jgi:hypothetical protein